MVWKKKPKRVHLEPEYRLKRGLPLFLPPEEDLYKPSLRKKIIEGFKWSWNRFKNDLYSLKPKEKISFLSPEMSWEEGKKASHFDLEQSEEKNSVLKPEMPREEVIKAPHFDLEQSIEKTSLEKQNTKNLDSQWSIQQKEQGEFSYKTLEDSGYTSNKKIREPVPKFTPLWKKVIAPLSAGAILAIATYFASNTNKNVKPSSLQATGKIQHLQKSKSATKTPVSTFATKKAQIIQKDVITYTVKKGDTFSEIVKQYVHKSGSKLYSDVNKIQKLNPSLMKNPDLIKPNQKIVLEIKNKLVDKEYKVRSEKNGQKTYFNTDGTKISPDLERQIILYETKPKPKDNALKLPKNKYKSIDNIIDNYNSTAGLFRKSKDEREKAYIANILDFARESGKTTIRATNAYIEHSKDSEAIKETIRKNYLYNSKSELDRILANKFEGLDTTKVKFTSIIDEKYGKGILRKRSKAQKKQSEFMRESELLYANLGQGKSEPILPANKIRRTVNA